MKKLTRQIVAGSLIASPVIAILGSMFYDAYKRSVLLDSILGLATVLILVSMMFLGGWLLGQLEEND